MDTGKKLMSNCEYIFNKTQDCKNTETTHKNSLQIPVEHADEKRLQKINEILKEYKLSNERSADPARV